MWWIWTLLYYLAPLLQRFAVYQPTECDPISKCQPDPIYENTHIDTIDGEKLNLILLNYTGLDSSAPTTLIFFHGNAGNIYDRQFQAKLMVDKLKANVVLVDYRGFGNSTGSPSEDGLHKDAEATLNYVMTHPNLSNTKVVLFGRSLGGAVALRLASDNPNRVKAIIVENTFFSFPAAAAGLAASCYIYLPMCFYTWLFSENLYLSFWRVRQCKMPSLFVSGLKDSLISPVMMKQLHELSPAQNKRLATFPEGEHMNTSECKDYFTVLEKFIKNV